MLVILFMTIWISLSNCMNLSSRYSAASAKSMIRSAAASLRVGIVLKEACSYFSISFLIWIRYDGLILKAFAKNVVVSSGVELLQMIFLTR